MERPNAAASFSVLLRLIGPSEAKGREESRKPRGACPPCLEFGHRKRIGKNGFTRRGRAIHQIPGDWSVFLEAFAMAFDNLTQRGKNSCVVLRFRPGKSGLWVQKITFWHRSLLVELIHLDSLLLVLLSISKNFYFQKTIFESDFDAFRIGFTRDSDTSLKLTKIPLCSSIPKI